MYRNFLKVAVRQILRDKFYSFINIAGLSIGLASSLLIILYIQDEVSYDRFHEKKDRIYRITETFKAGEGTLSTALTPYRLAHDLKAKFPVIEEVVRIDYDVSRHIVEYRKKRVLEKGITAVDSNFFAFFSFPLLQGNPKTVLREVNTVVISEEKAKFYFPNENAVGKVLKFIMPYSRESYQVKVTGVFKTMPENSHFHKDFLLSSLTADHLIQNRKDELGWTSHFSYLLLSPGVNPEKLEKDINTFIFKNYKGVMDFWSYFSLQSLNDIHLKSNLKEELEANGDITYIYVFSAIALMILVLACINYMNLATARAFNRSREVGVRKVIGALKRELVFQFLGESVLITFLALIVAGFLTELFLPIFNSLAGKHMSVSFFNWKVLLAFFTITMLIGLAAGSYPAFFLSSFNPAKVLKGSLSKAGNRSVLFRKVLVIGQFSISIALIIGTMVIYVQWNYLQEKKLGIETEQILVIPMETEKQAKGYARLKNELLRNSDILNVSASQKNFTDRFTNFTTIYWEDKELILPWAKVDCDFFKTFNIPVVLGRDFRPARNSKDSLDEFILNEEAIKILNFKSPLGTEIHALSRDGRITGVVKNFHLESLHSKIGPVIFSTESENYVAGFENLFVKIKGDNYSELLNFIKEKYIQNDPEAPFTYTFLNDNIQNLYQTEEKFFKIFITFACLAIFIACLGIFGLASFTASQRTKEIGIRKVLGASSSSITLLLTEDFLKLVLMANLIAWPCAYSIIQKWLDSFPYQTNFSLWIFVIATGIALAIALLTVSTQAIRAAVADPVKAIKSGE